MILVCIVAYDPGQYYEYIKENIKLLTKLADVSIMVIENDGKTNTVDKLQREFNNQDITYIVNPQPCFPGAAFNQALRSALQSENEFCYFLDQDSLIDENTISELKKVNGDFSFLASCVVDEDTFESLPYFRGNLNSAMTFHSIKRNHNAVSSINAAGYTGLFINMQIVQQHSLFVDENLKIELDDYDFTYRLSTIKPGLLIDESKVTHPNKKPGRNGFFGEVLDAYLQLFYINRKGRSKIHITNYLYLINQYGSSAFASFKKVLARTQWINSLLLKTKQISQ